MGSMEDIRTADADEKRQDLTPDEFRLAIQDMKTRTALGPDAWRPALLAALSRHGMASPADLINAIETKVWPRQLLRVWWVLLTKSWGTLKNKAKNDRWGYSTMPLRTWERIRTPGLANWCQQRPGRWDAAVARSSALGNAVLSMALDETPATTATPTMT